MRLGTPAILITRRRCTLRTPISYFSTSRRSSMPAGQSTTRESGRCWEASRALPSGRTQTCASSGMGTSRGRRSRGICPGKRKPAKAWNWTGVTLPSGNTVAGSGSSCTNTSRCRCSKRKFLLRFGELRLLHRHVVRQLGNGAGKQLVAAIALHQEWHLHAVHVAVFGEVGLLRQRAQRRAFRGHAPHQQPTVFIEVERVGEHAAGQLPAHHVALVPVQRCRAAQRKRTRVLALEAQVAE